MCWLLPLLDGPATNLPKILFTYNGEQIDMMHVKVVSIQGWL